MTKQEIITLLIKDYEEAIEKCKGMRRYQIIHKHLQQERMMEGVCYVAKARHNEAIYAVEWVNRNGFYWTDIPRYIFNKKEIIQSLQTRLSILKTELEIPE